MSAGLRKSHSFRAASRDASQVVVWLAPLQRPCRRFTPTERNHSASFNVTSAGQACSSSRRRVTSASPTPTPGSTTFLFLYRGSASTSASTGRRTAPASTSIAPDLPACFNIHPEMTGVVLPSISISSHLKSGSLFHRGVPQVKYLVRGVGMKTRAPSTAGTAHRHHRKRQPRPPRSVP